MDEEGNIRKQSEELVMERLRDSFRPEFLNRLDEIIMFKPLSKNNIIGIIDLVIGDLNRRVSDKEIQLTLTEEAKQFIADQAYDPMYGARPLKRYIQKHVETLLAREILQDHIHSGNVVVLKVDGRGIFAEIN